MNLENLLQQAVTLAAEASKTPLGQKVKEKVEKGVVVAAALSQNLPNQEQWAQLIEERSPQLAQTFLNYASEVSNPHQIGMGLKILELSDDGIRVQLPNRWRNRSEAGTMHSGALMTLAEFAGRRYWERLVDRKLGEVKLLEVQANFHKSTFRQVVANFNLAGEERERILFELRKNGEVRTESSIVVFGKGEQRVADFSLLWQISSPLVVTGSEAKPEAEAASASPKNSANEVDEESYSAQETD